MNCCHKETPKLTTPQFNCIWTHPSSKLHDRLDNMLSVIRGTLQTRKWKSKHVARCYSKIWKYSACWSNRLKWIRRPTEPRHWVTECMRVWEFREKKDSVEEAPDTHEDYKIMNNPAYLVLPSGDRVRKHISQVKECENHGFHHSWGTSAADLAQSVLNDNHGRDVTSRLRRNNTCVK